MSLSVSWVWMMSRVWVLRAERPTEEGAKVDAPSVSGACDGGED